MNGASIIPKYKTYWYNAIMFENVHILFVKKKKNNKKTKNKQTKKKQQTNKQTKKKR